MIVCRPRHRVIRHKLWISPPRLLALSGNQILNSPRQFLQKITQLRQQLRIFPRDPIINRNLSSRGQQLILFMKLRAQAIKHGIHSITSLSERTKIQPIDWLLLHPSLPLFRKFV
ncbi:hypothetical protein BGLA2_1080014 [Burkholderia gladioli]|nr:hypothetical protein BGLA2_1080014 [Burkholderia gladioli]